MKLVCKCGHTQDKHRDYNKNLFVCVSCCPTDFSEEIHMFTPDNLLSLENELEDSI